MVETKRLVRRKDWPMANHGHPARNKWHLDNFTTIATELVGTQSDASYWPSLVALRLTHGDSIPNFNWICSRAVQITRRIPQHDTSAAPRNTYFKEKTTETFRGCVSPSLDDNWPYLCCNEFLNWIEGGTERFEELALLQLMLNELNGKLGVDKAPTKSLWLGSKHAFVMASVDSIGMQPFDFLHICQCKLNFWVVRHRSKPTGAL